MAFIPEVQIAFFGRLRGILEWLLASVFPNLVLYDAVASIRRPMVNLKLLKSLGQQDGVLHLSHDGSKFKFQLTLTESALNQDLFSKIGLRSI